MMGSDQHTPGPWFVAGVRFRMNGGEWHGIHRYDEAKKQDENIAAVGYDPRTGAGWADAQLIASAPTMAARITELEAALSAATAERDEARKQRDHWRAQDKERADREPDLVAAREAAEAEAARLREETGRARNALDNQLGHVFLMRKAVAAEDPLSQLLIRCDDMARDIRAALGGGQ